MKRSTLIILVIVVVVMIIAVAILVVPRANGARQTVRISVSNEGWTQQNISFRAGSESSRSDLTYSWSFGDGTEGEGIQLNHAYYAAGNYFINLIAVDSNGSKFSSSAKVEVKPSERLVTTAWGRWNDSSSEMNGKFYANLTLTNLGPSAIAINDSVSIKSYQYNDGSQYIFPGVRKGGMPPPLSPGQNTSWTSYFDLPLNRTPLSIIYGGWLEAKLPFLSLGNLTVYFIDVGQGDSILVETPEKAHVLIDAGDEAADSIVVSFLQSHSVAVLDALILTHPDADHIGGADEVLKSFQVRSIYLSGFSKETTAYHNLASAAAAEDCPILTDEQIDVGDLLQLNSSVRFQVLSINAHASSSNDASICLKLTYGTVDFLFTGDIDSTVENAMMSNPALNLDVEILKVSHHGSRYATSTSFLSATSPAIGVISVGTGNDYGHPALETLQRLTSDAVAIYRTDLNGTVTITTNGEEWIVGTAK